ncbi:MAG: hypothetical protein AAFU85_28505 [Planctomycetota bacterium]
MDWIISTIALLGMALIVAGVAMFSTAIALIVCGVMLCVLAVALHLHVSRLPSPHPSEPEQ